MFLKSNVSKVAVVTALGALVLFGFVKEQQEEPLFGRNLADEEEKQRTRNLAANDGNAVAIYTGNMNTGTESQIRNLMSHRGLQTYITRPDCTTIGGIIPYFPQNGAEATSQNVTLDPGLGNPAYGACLVQYTQFCIGFLTWSPSGLVSGQSAYDWCTATSGQAGYTEPCMIPLSDLCGRYSLTPCNYMAYGATEPGRFNDANYFGTGTCRIESSGAGVNGDPLIMGLAGQLFKFDGRSGGWYSAVSTPSFQWNMRITQYDGCPAHSNNFVSGAAFTFKEDGKADKHIEVKVIDVDQVKVGCGEGPENCLGAGSLEIIIDGVKHTVGGDYTFASGDGRILAYNSFHQCARKWYDFEVLGEDDPSPSAASNIPLLQGGSVSVEGDSMTPQKPGVFDVISDIKETMIDQQVCEEWLAERKKWGDLFAQPGHSSTVIIQTTDITLHLEYRQEHERCQAHLLDIWISKASTKLTDEPWEGVIGETRNCDHKDDSVEPGTLQDRKKVLKFENDADYEVTTPYGNKCKGCIEH